MFNLESKVERDFCNKIRDWAGRHHVEMEVIKLNLRGRRGWPDRIILWQGGHTMFIEFKREGEEARPLQEYIHGILREMGFTVEIYDDAESAINDVKARVGATALADKGNDARNEGGRVSPVPETGTRQDSRGPEDLFDTEV
jgi:hypothetical protein